MIEPMYPLPLNRERHEKDHTHVVIAETFCSGCPVNMIPVLAGQDFGGVGGMEKSTNYTWEFDGRL